MSSFFFLFLTPPATTTWARDEEAAGAWAAPARAGGEEAHRRDGTTPQRRGGAQEGRGGKEEGRPRAGRRESTGQDTERFVLSTLIRIWINLDELLHPPFWYLTNGCGLWLTGVYTSTAGGGAEAPGDPATAAPPWTGHASGESHSTSFFPLLSFKKNLNELNAVSAFMP